MAFAAYSDNDIPVLTQQKWSIVDKVISLHRPFEQIARKLCEEDSSLTDVIPSILAIRMTSEIG